MKFPESEVQLRKFNVNVVGEGTSTLVMVHGFGCNQSMWLPMAERLAGRYRLVLLDLAGCGLAEAGAYDEQRHAALEGYADDVLEVARSTAQGGEVVLVGHSVGASICLAACLKAPGAVDALVLVAPSPCYLNDGDYHGGMEPAHIDDVIRCMHEDRRGWAESFATQLLGEGQSAQLGRQFVESFCAAQQGTAEPFARLAFLVDQRAELARVRTPTLILQSLHDPLVPVAVGEYMHRHVAGSRLVLVDDVGHSPHLTAPGQCARALQDFLTAQSIF